MLTLGFVVMGALTVLTLLVLVAAVRQEHLDQFQRTVRSAGARIRPAWLYGLILALLAATLVVEVWGFAVSLTGYQTQPLQPAHALTIAAVVLACGIVALFVYMAAAQMEYRRRASAAKGGQQ
jgi:hypothetical protein